MKSLFIAILLIVPTLTLDAEPLEYVKVCDAYGAGFFYVPGTDTCMNPTTGDSRRMTEGGVWRTTWPYPEGDWITRLKQDCKHGQIVHLGNFASTDFTLNPFAQKQTAAVPLNLAPSSFISRVYMSGGFYDPRVSEARSGINNNTAFCVRSVDPEELEDFGGEDGPVNPPYGGLPIGCIANSRILNMPAAYGINATAAYPSVDQFFNSADQNVAGPYLYGTHLVVTTDMANGGENLLKYAVLTGNDEEPYELFPLEGTLSVSVCVQRGLANPLELDRDISLGVK